MATRQDPTDPTGVAVDPDTRGEARLRPRERKANAALALRLEGYSWEEIAEVVGYPGAREAQVAFESAFEAHVDNDPQMKSKMRDLAGRRLDRLLRAVWKQAVNEPIPVIGDDGEPVVDSDGNALLTTIFDDVQVQYHKQALAVIGQHSTLYGLSAPTEIKIDTPTDAALANWVASVIAQGNGYEEEQDIFSPRQIEGTVLVEDED